MTKEKKDGAFIKLIKSFVTKETVSKTALALANAIITEQLNKASGSKTKPSATTSTPISTGRPPNITKYLALHEQVMNLIDANKQHGVYKPNPINNKIEISCINEAAKILSEADLEHYIKYYNWFHGGSGKHTGRYDPNDVFVAIPRK